MVTHWSRGGGLCLRSGGLTRMMGALQRMRVGWTFFIPALFDLGLVVFCWAMTSGPNSSVTTEIASCRHGFVSATVTREKGSLCSTVTVSIWAFSPERKWKPEWEPGKDLRLVVIFSCYPPYKDIWKSALMVKAFLRPKSCLLRFSEWYQLGKWWLRALSSPNICEDSFPLHA